jgi:CHAD domain-containing protein
VTEASPVSYQFHDGETSAEGAGRIAREQIGKAADRLEADASGSSFDEAIHDARKRIKKARAILRLARGPIGKNRADKADRRLRDAARPLSESRDASVLLRTFDDLTGATGDSPQPETVSEGRRFLSDRLDEMTRNLRAEGGPVAEATSALRSIHQRIGRWDLRGDDSEPVSGLKRSYKRGRAALGDVLVDPTPEAFHRLRKRVKDLGYQLRAVGGDPGDHASRIDELGQHLGELHDLDVLRSILPRPASDPILPRIEKRRRDLQRLALKEARPIFLKKPRAFARESGGATSSHGSRPAD